MLILEANNIKKYFGYRLILDIESIKIYSEDRIGIVGLNGAGKTTLLNILSGQIAPDEGNVKMFGKCSYITQLGDDYEGAADYKIAREFNVPVNEVSTLSGGEKTRLRIAKVLSSDSDVIFADEPTCNLDMEGIEILQEKLSSYKGALVIISHDRELLDRLLFKTNDVYKKAGVLSGGERVKASIAKLLVSEFNLLILDEHTNYLDIYSVEALESALYEYTGALLIVSHDRRFIEHIANSIMIIQEANIVSFDESYKEYLLHKKMSASGNLEKRRIILENWLTHVLGRLSMPSKNDDIAALDSEYKEILKELNSIKNGTL